jgi:phosphoribosylformylglycinamidine synthase
VADTTASLPRPASAQELRATALRLLASPNLASKAWVTDQYDRFVQGNTALAQPDDGGVIRVDESTHRGVALATDANGRYAKLDPRTGAQLALAEAYRNVATAGAVPLAVTDCLNFGSPENPDSMWQLVEAIEGLADACQELGVPVTGGNVSLYNETGAPGLVDSAIHPTPVVGVLGVVDDVRSAVPSGWRSAGLSVVLLGETRDELDGSAWADVEHQHLGGVPPRVDLAAEKALASVLIGARAAGAVAAHDLSEGGLIQALLESSLRYGVGVQASVAPLVERDGVPAFAALFSETTARALVAVDPARVAELLAAASSAGVPALTLGTTGGDAVVVDDVTITLDEAREAHEGTLPKLFG